MTKQSFPYKFAAIGLLLSVIVHISAIICQCITLFPWVFILGMGIFYPFFHAIKAQQKVFLPAAKKGFGIKKIKENLSHLRSMQKSQMEVFRKRPIWLKALCIVVIGYGFISFFITTTLKTGNVEFEDGQYAIKNQGKFVRFISESEYNYQNSLTVRMFTGHPAIFYAISMIMGYRKEEPIL